MLNLYSNFALALQIKNNYGHVLNGENFKHDLIWIKGYNMDLTKLRVSR